MIGDQDKTVVAAGQATSGLSSPEAGPEASQEANRAAAFDYKAFLSYSHMDKKWGAWLHRALEKYRIPPNLQLSEGAKNPEAPQHSGSRTIGRIFRDRDELPAAEDLTEAVRKALATSEYMIVLCSPNSAASRWVNKEIIEFKRLRGDKYVLPIIIDGEPFASDNGAPERECFPPAVRFKIAKTGGLSTLPAEPAAADARKDADGKQRAVLKLLAGILGVGLDQLVEREMRRRQKRVMAITAGAILAMIVMATLTYEAVKSRDAADRSRAEAEDLVEFMLTDLREKLEPVGRLDVLDAVGEKVLSYHENQLEYEDASDDDIGRRARAYHLLGELHWRRGNWADAENLFNQAKAATAELLQRDPNNTKRIFEHAQSIFWVGSQHYERGNFTETEHAFREYKAKADLLIAKEPENTDWLIEVAYGNHNLGDLLLRGKNRPLDAIPYIRDAADLFQKAFAERPNSLFLKKYVAVEFTSLADAHRYFDTYEMVSRFSELEKETLDELVKADPRDLGIKRQLLYWNLREGWLLAIMAQQKIAFERYQAALELAKILLKMEPDNELWQEDIAMIGYHQANALMNTGEYIKANYWINEADGVAVKLFGEDALISRHRVHLKLLGDLVKLKYEINDRGILSSTAKINSVMELVSSQVDMLKQTQRGRWLIVSLSNIKLKLLLAHDLNDEAKHRFEQILKLVDASNHHQVPSVIYALLQMSETMGASESVKMFRKILLDRGYLRSQASVGTDCIN